MLEILKEFFYFIAAELFRGSRACFNT